MIGEKFSSYEVEIVRVITFENWRSGYYLRDKVEILEPYVLRSSLSDAIGIQDFEESPMRW